jgi:uncharacterized membrane protein
MKPLVVLVCAFLVSLVLSRMLRKRYDYILCGNIAMAVMLFFTAAGHFLFLDGMANMLPEIVPERRLIIIVTGVLEAAAGVGLLFSKSRRVTGTLLIVFFVAVLPANFYAAFHHVDIETGKPTGPGPNYLWFRIPLQLLFIVWVCWFAVLRRDPSAPTH